MLESNFALVGDDGSKNVDEIETQLQKESEHMFTLWCSGRTCCEGMLVELKFIKRQDLVSVISNMIKPACDQVRIHRLYDCSCYVCENACWRSVHCWLGQGSMSIDDPSKSH